MPDKRKIAYINKRDASCKTFSKVFDTKYNVLTTKSLEGLLELSDNDGFELVVVDSGSVDIDQLLQILNERCHLSCIFLNKKGQQVFNGHHFCSVRMDIETPENLEALDEVFRKSFEMIDLVHQVQMKESELKKCAIEIGGATDEEEGKANKEESLEIIDFNHQKVFAKIYELSSVGIPVLNVEGRILNVNNSFLKLLDYSERSLKGKSLLDLVLEEDKAVVKASLKMLASGQELSAEMECRFLKFNGDVIVSRLSMVAIANSSGKIKMISGLLMDVTESKLIENQLIESERELRILAESSPIHILKIDRDYSIQFINNAFGGREQSKLIGTNLFHWIPKNESVKIRKNIDEVFETQKSVKSEVLMSYSKSEQAWFSAILGPIIKDGKVDTVMLLATNITDQKDAIRMKERFTQNLEIKVSERTAELQRAKLRLARSLEREKELGELKSRFVATASHQFRTPLTVIQSNMGMLAMQRKKMNKDFIPAFEKSYGRIKGQISRMTNMMDDVLILGKINTGNVQHKLEPTDLVELCKEVTNNYNEIESKDRDVIFKMSGTPTLLFLDRKLMEHAISNLISNALKYSPENTSPTVGLKFNKGNVKLSVKDEGIGIPKEDLKHLFEPFYRASNVGEVTGTGLGSTIVKEYVELNRGTISVKSQISKGTEFIIEFKDDRFIKNEELWNLY